MALVLAVPPIVIVQGTPRAGAWPWLLVIGVGGALVLGAVPFALEAWAKRFPAAAERAESWASGPRWWVGWAVLFGVALVLRAR